MKFIITCFNVCASFLAASALFLGSQANASTGLPFVFGGVNDADTSSVVNIDRNSDDPYALAIDGNGNIFVGGDTLGENINFSANSANPLTVISNSTISGGTHTQDGYLASYHANGLLRWVLLVQGESDSLTVSSVVTDSSQNIYVAGVIQGATNLNLMDADGNVALLTSLTTPQNSRAGFVAKLDTDGSLTWVKTLAQKVDSTRSANKVKLYEINIDTNANVFVAGQFYGIVDLDPSASEHIITSYDDENDQNDDTFIVKLDVNGNFLWARAKGGHNDSDSINDIVIDENNNVYIGGEMSSDTDGVSLDDDFATLEFDATVGANRTDGSGSDSSADFGFVQKLDNDTGNVIWSREFLAPAGYHDANSEVKAISYDNDNNRLIIGGDFDDRTDFNPDFTIEDDAPNEGLPGSSDLFVVSLDSTGKLIWYGTLGNDNGETDEQVDAVHVSNGNIYIAADINGSAFDGDGSAANIDSWDLNIPASAGDQDAMVIKLDKDGDFIWVKTFGGLAYDTGDAFAEDAGGYVYLSGQFRVTADLDPTNGVFNVSTQDYQVEGNTSGRDAFVVKLDTNGTFQSSSAGDNDGDGTDDLVDKDDDNDLVPDEEETSNSTDSNDPTSWKDDDGDGVPDYLDLGGKGYEEGEYVDETGTPLDSDNDGISDYLERNKNTAKNYNEFVENQAAISLKFDQSVFDANSYGNGSFAFDITNSTINDVLFFYADSTTNANLGAVSVVGNDVYLGNGSSADIVGSIDDVNNGQDGKPLQVNFTTNFVNSKYEVGIDGDTEIQGWTTVLEQVILGTTTIAGQSTPLDNSYPENAVDDTDIPSNLGTLSVALDATEIRAGSTGLSARLSSSGMTTLNGYDVVRGPAIYSNTIVKVNAGDTISFDWRAKGGGDAYDVFGYIVDVNSGTTQVLLNETGSSDSGETPWATVTDTIDVAGEYRFVFISGTYDFTGFKGAGAQLFMDSYNVSSSALPGLDSEQLALLADKVRYVNGSDSIDGTTRQVSITAVDSLSAIDNGNAIIDITSINDAPVLAAMANSVDVVERLTNVIGATANDIDSTNLTFSLSGDDATRFVIDSNSGEVSFANPPLFLSPGDVNADNQYQIEIVVTDDGQPNLTDSHVLTVNVLQDSDQDGVPNDVETSQGSDPQFRGDYLDTDGDGVPDFLDDDGTIDDDSGNGIINYYMDYPLPFQCDGSYFISRSKTLFKLGTSTTPFTFNDVAPAGYTGKVYMNAFGFNYQDGYIYGLSKVGNDTYVYRIEGSGHMRQMFKLDGVSFTNNGGFDLEGNLYVTKGKNIYTIDVANETYIVEAMSASVGSKVADIAFNVRDGNLYGTKDNKLFKINLHKGNHKKYKVTSKNITDLPADTFGSSWFDAAGRLYISSNSTGDIYRIDDIENPAASYVSKGEPTNQNDGTSCAAAPLLEHTISPSTTAPDSVVTHTYRLDNALMSGDSFGDPLTIEFNDVLSDGRTFVADSLIIDGALANGAINAYGNANTLIISDLQLDTTSTVTITIDVAIPDSLEGIYYNQAKITNVASYLGGTEVLSDNPGGIAPDASPLVVVGSNNDNRYSGHVFNDINKNGTKDNGETGAAGIRISLDSGAVTTTDINGDYLFEGLTDGSYIASMTLPSGYVQVSPLALNAVAVSGGIEVKDNNFYVYPLSSIVGSVFSDVDGDSRIGSLDSGLTSVTVKLLNSNGNKLKETTTNENGEFVFGNLDGGLYWIEQVDAAGYTSVSPNLVSVNLGVGQEVERNFADIKQGTISGIVFDDLNGNQLQDSGEEPLAGVTIGWNNGSHTGNTTTDANGFYTLLVTPGQAYTITETDPDGYASIGSNTRSISVSTGGAATVNFADIKKWTISGTVYEDFNGNDQLDQYEVGLSDVRVTLSDGTQTTTDVDGNYQFTGIDAGRFNVKAVEPANYSAIFGATDTVTVPTGGAATANFAMVRTGTVAGTVFNDSNGNGVKDSNESGVAGVLVEVNGNFLYTLADGSYEFTSVPVGPYDVTFTTPEGYKATTSGTQNIILDGNNGASANFGVRPNGTINVVAFNDINNNGIQDAGELGMGNVAVSIDGGAANYTAANGSLVFSFLNEGDSHSIQFVAPAGFNSSQTLTQTITATDSVAIGFKLDGSVSGIVFDDANGNGVFDLDEVGVGNVVVTLSGDDNANTTTAADGSYLFNALVGTNQKLTITSPSQYRVTGVHPYEFALNVSETHDFALRNVASIVTPPVPNSPPVAFGQVLSTEQDTPLEITLSARDSDGDSLIYSVLAPANGSLVGSVNNWTYTPHEGFHGPDSFTFTVFDGNDISNSAAIRIEVIEFVEPEPEPENKAPIAFEQRLVTAQNTAVTITLQGSDEDGDELTYQLTSSPSNGLLSGGGNVFTYTPDTSYLGSDGFTFFVNDGEADSIEATVHISVESHDEENQLPVAVDDYIVVSNWQPIDVNVLSNDSDPDGDALSLVSVSSAMGSASIIDGKLHYIPVVGYVGETVIYYSIVDDKGNVASAIVVVSIEPDDTSLLPTISVPADRCGDLSVNAEALYTRVELGVASAVDRFGNRVPVSLVDGTTLFPPGLSYAYWQATDSEGNTAIAAQKVCVIPLVSVQKDQTVLEGETTTIGIYLNGNSPTYPVIVPYTLTGDADSSDHDLISGEAIINKGTEVKVAIEIYQDDLDESAEQLVLTLDSENNRGPKFSHATTIDNGNISPEAALFVSQAGEQRMLVTQTGGNVIVESTIYDPNIDDSHVLQWTPSNSAMVNLAQGELVFSFDPSVLAVGTYYLELKVVDSGIPAKDDITTVYLQVVDSLSTLSGNDSDGDNIPDNIEGYQDSDGDGIPNYFDRINECNVLTEEVINQDGYLVESEPGVCLRRGDFTLTGETGGAHITDADVAAKVGDIVEDEEAINVGGIFDFIAYGLPDDNQSVAITLPQRSPVPAQAVYRKYTKAAGWHLFTEDEENTLWSTAGEPGYCPPSRSELWQPGLTEGHWCVQVVIQDGGPNDDDGEINGTVIDPGYVGVMKSMNTPPEADSLTVEIDLNQSIDIDIASLIFDADGDLLSLTSSTVAIGNIDVNELVVSYTPLPDYSGQDTIVYGISDGNGGTTSAVITIEIVDNLPPVTGEVAVITIKQNADTGPTDVLAVATDPEQDDIRLISATSDYGDVKITDDQQLIFSPSADFVGTATINYVIADTYDQPAIGELTVVVEPFHEVISVTKSSGGAMGIFMFLLALIAVYRLRSAHA